ncbi:MAG: AMP-binding protein [Alphaproteobacteria bacterium]
MSANDIVWTPPDEMVANSNLQRFFDRHGLADYDALLAKADADPDWFWNAAIGFLDIRFFKPYDKVRDLFDGPAWAKWCVGGTTNLALNCLDKHRDTPTEHKTAIVWEAEDGHAREMTYAELDAESCRLAAALAELGVTSGDPVGMYLPMLPEAAAAFYAIARIGGVVVPLFSGFGAESIASRLADAGAVAVVCADGTMRRGQPVAMKAIMDEALASVPTVKHVIVAKRAGLDVPMTAGRDHDWDELLAGKPARFATAQVPAEHPLLLVYTSGTTGRPKGTVVTHIGVTTKMGVDFCLALDLKPDDRLLWMTDFGWVVGPMTVTATAFVGGTIVLTEGTPDYPQKGRFWRLIQDYKVSFVGMAPTAVRSLMRHGVAEVQKYDLSTVRVSASTGEPWTDEAWNWFFEHVCGKRAPLLNWSGGTEIGGGILCGTVIHPLKPCAFARALPGMGADIVDDHGEPVGPGQVGELVLRTPSIGLTKGLWKDPDRYLETYWEMFAGMWRHGDWASRDSDGMWYVHGRSDDTIKIAGKRTGPAEIEGQLMATGKVLEAAAVGVPDPISGEALLCVCVPAPGITPSDELAEELREAVAHGFGRPFKPKRLVFADDLPKTRNLKIMRRVVRAVATGSPPGDLTALVNPEAVEALEPIIGPGG